MIAYVAAPSSIVLPIGDVSVLFLLRNKFYSSLATKVNVYFITERNTNYRNDWHLVSHNDSSFVLTTKYGTYLYNSPGRIQFAKQIVWKAAHNRVV